MKPLFHRCQNLFFPFVTDIFNTIVSFFIFLSLLVLLGYMGIHTLNIIFSALQGHFQHTVHDIVFTIVLVKAYKILVYYLRKHHISIRYILQVAIIAPIIEVVFMSDEKAWWLTLIFAGFSVACLFLYFFFYKTISQMEK